MKVCPYCAEEIKDEAVKCKHCGEFLNRKSSLDNSALTQKGDGSFWQRFVPALISLWLLMALGPVSEPVVINGKVKVMDALYADPLLGPWVRFFGACSLSWVVATVSGDKESKGCLVFFYAIVGLLFLLFLSGSRG